MTHPKPSEKGMKPTKLTNEIETKKFLRESILVNNLIKISSKIVS